MSSVNETVVVDFETTIDKATGNPSAFVPSNRVVLAGALRNWVCTYEHGAVTQAVYHAMVGNTLVGHNIAFDLMYMFREMSLAEIKQAIRAGFQIWDTQIAEYVLSGQAVRMSTLDDLSNAYGGTLKDRRVAEMFEAGLGADEIDPAVLKEYLEGDLKNTKLVYDKQVEEAKRTGKYALIQYMNMARLCTALMQFYGMRVDVSGMNIARHGLVAEATRLAESIAFVVDVEVKKATKHLGPNARLHKDVNLVSDNMLSCYVFGGTANIDFIVPTGELYKSGARAGTKKTKVVSCPVKFTNKRMPFRDTKASKNYSLIHPMDDDVLEILNKDGLSIAMDIQRLRRIDKIVGTYIDGVLKNVYPDGCVHPNYNHALTATGRLSCSNPNLQNQDGEVKQFFQSATPEHEYLVEFDFKQLEVIGLAYLSQDPQLIADIRNGVDLHYETGRTVFGWTSTNDMDEVTRRGVKGVNFGLIYGGSAKGLSKQTGFALFTVERLINSFYSRYPRVREWQEENIKKVKEDRTYVMGVYGHTEKGYPQGQSILRSITGRSYRFKEYDAPDWLVARGTHTSFSPTEIKNYPVQGFATGDLVPITLAVMLQFWARSEIDCLPCVTVHDSFGFSCRDRNAVHGLNQMVQKQVIPAVLTVLKDTWGIELGMPLVVEPKYGKNWGDMKKMK